jgi:thioredoxin-related protein
MKKVSSVMVVTIFCLQVLTAQGIKFSEKAWLDLLAEAKAQNKIIFVDAYTTWCGPCKMMAANVFPDKEVGAFYNKNFINAKIDMERGDGLLLAQTYQVNAYPTFLFINGNGDLVHRGVGYREADTFISLGTQANDPAEQLVGLEKRYKAGDRTAGFMVHYVTALQNAGLESSAVANEYIMTLETYDDEATMQFILEATTSISQRGFVIMTENLKQFYEVFGEEGINDRINYILLEEYFGDMNQMEAAYAQYFDKKTGDRFFGKYQVLHFMYSREEGAINGLMPAAENYFANFGSDMWEDFNSVAWFVYENSDDAAQLEKAAKWAEQSIAIEPNFFNMDTAAALYFKLKNKKKAKKMAQAAIEKGKAAGENTSETEALLEQIEAL